jgi:hypothetical protein
MVVVLDDLMGVGWGGFGVVVQAMLLLVVLSIDMAAVWPISPVGSGLEKWGFDIVCVV